MLRMTDSEQIADDSTAQEAPPPPKVKPAPRRPRRRLGSAMRALLGFFFGLVILAVAGLAGVAWVINHYARELPDYKKLIDYQPPTVTRLHAGDGRLMAEFATEKRVFIPIDAMPKRIVRAFLAAEDKNFYDHPGIDIYGIARAILTNVENMRSDRRPMGASTITQQVAKNMLLTNEVSIARKVKEALLAIRIERTLSKHRILELYLNEIFLGYRSYGVAAAALNYFNHSLDELTVAEAAYLAALPKAPNNYHPERQHEAAVARRNWVINRMLEDGYLSPPEAAAAIADPLVTRRRDETETVAAEYFTEEARRELIKRYGEKTLYEGGLSVRTSLNPKLQDIATRALRNGLISYDRRHGWRGAVSKVTVFDKWAKQLAAIPMPKGGEAWRLAVVLDAKPNADSADIGFGDGARGRLPLSELRWARAFKDDDQVGPEIRRITDVVSLGDVVLVEAASKDERGRPLPPNSYGLRQIPEVGGGLVALDPHTGRVLAISGGFSPAMSVFNRATQALRQPGSAFKPFVYLTALENGFTPSSLVLDAPFEYSPGPGQPVWRPENYSQKFYGPTPLRVGIEKSRNVMTVRLAAHLGMDKIKTMVEKFGIVDNLQPYLPMSLGAGETTVLRLTSAYGIIVNGGKRITPSFIDRVQDRNGKTIFRHDDRPCIDCQNPWIQNTPVPVSPDTREQIADARYCHQMVSILEGVVQRGTATKIAAIGKPLAGKTGTTNDSNDAWFVGFSPDLAVGLYIGFDQPRSLGGKETGGSAAVPIFKDFMEEALKDQPGTPFRIPPGLKLVRVNPENGRPASPGDRKAIWEAFIPGTEPGSGKETPLLDGSSGGNSFSSTSSPGGNNSDADQETESWNIGPGNHSSGQGGGGQQPTGSGTGGLY
ncbi:Penicillin-insensitive transglycosylase / Penicillin-sensitive transpeptidase [Azospirillaceae bacterium]